jgi:hypothetical protein
MNCVKEQESNFEASTALISENMKTIVDFFIYNWLNIAFFIKYKASMFTSCIISDVTICFDVPFGQHRIQSPAKSALKWMPPVSQKRHTKFETIYIYIVLKYLALFSSLNYSYSSATFDGLGPLVRSD